MKSIRTLCMVATGILLLAGTAQAAVTLSTAPMRISHDEAVGDELLCMVVNVGTKDVEVGITSVLDNTVQTGLQPVAPGLTFTWTNQNNAAVPLLGRCTFEVKGGKKNVRASACALDAFGSCRAAVPAR